MFENDQYDDIFQENKIQLICHQGSWLGSAVFLPLATALRWFVKKEKEN